MSAIIEEVRDVLRDPDAGPFEKQSRIGILAMLIVVCDDGTPEYQEARDVVIAFWREGRLAA